MQDSMKYQMSEMEDKKEKARLKEEFVQNHLKQMQRD